MKVTFTRTAKRRYRVSVEGPGVVSSWMEPAPGYDDRLPHDMAHFVVENELGISGGVFGQLAAGGHARTFSGTAERRKNKVVKRGNRIAAANRDDANLSERIVGLACATWKNNPSAVPSTEGVSAEDIKRVCREFDAVSAVWSKLKVGESMTLTWDGQTDRSGKRRSRHR
ncbi:MAG TPA: hypothetical protein VFH31_01000 [Pyrinomonadaceae bacterium]|nr:hypothetical protein [Pyrinomonadaceae bacterium]